MPKRPTGTREWADKNLNFCRGCEHDCRYCYARANALRFHFIENPGQWKDMKVNMDKVNKRFMKHDGSYMFPTTHDITPSNLAPAIQLLDNVLKPGNDVLIVSKPHLECIRAICDAFQSKVSDDGKPYKEHILFRFTIGSTNDDVLGFWEPHAPKFQERLEALKCAFNAGYKTSVSGEPMLDDKPVELFRALEPYVTDSIWLGKMNKIGYHRPDGSFVKQRIDTTGWILKDWDYWYLVQNSQSDLKIRSLYEALKDEPKIKWKDSVKEVIGLPKPEKVGMDV